MSLAVRSAILVALAVLLTGVSTAGLAIVLGRDGIRQTALAATAAGAEANGRAVVAYMTEAQSVMRDVADLPIVGEPWQAGEGPAAPEDEVPLRAALRPFVEADHLFEYVAIVRPSGEIHVLEPAGLQAGLARTDLSFYPWFTQLRATGAAISDLHIATATRRPSVVVAAVAQDPSGAVHGYVVGGIRLSGLSALIGAPQGAYFGYLTDSRGLVIAHGREPRFANSQTDFSEVPAVRLALAGESGAIEDHNPIELEDRVAGYTSVPGLDWATVYVVPTEVAYAPAATMALSIGGVSVAVITLFGIAAMVFARGFVAPITRLSVVAAKLAAGERDVALPRAGWDEVGRLTRDFGQMVEAIDARESALRQQAAELLAANRELEAFTYSVSHDLRAPVRAIDSFGRILLDEHGQALDGEGRRVLGKVLESAQRMSLLIDDLLHLSRMSRKEFQPRPIGMAAMVENVVEELAAREPDRVVDLAVDALPDAVGDPALVRQVWQNLLENAFKFTQRVARPAIRVWSEATPGEQRYFVRDNGVGFEQEYGHTLFKPFSRLHTRDEFDGTGIGLAIVARIVEIHGGRVWAESQLGKGATFGFALPTASEAT